MHAVRRELLEAQARAVDLPLWPIRIPWPCSNEDYELRMGEAVTRAREFGITNIAFGDLFLEDIRRYRVEKLHGTGIEPLFPIWGLPTDRLARQMIGSGLKAILTCVDPRKIDKHFVGRQFDEQLLSELPVDADPCGENGEFHTFCYAGPMFAAPIPVSVGEIQERDGFVFADVIRAHKNDEKGV